MLRKRGSSVLQDARGYLEYRNRVYHEENVWPETTYAQIKILINFFKNNVNGFRDLFYYRSGNSIAIRILKKIFKPTANLVLDVGNISEGGCMFHHAFSSYINAEYVGYQCTFRNNTTIGNKMVNGKLVRPYIEDNVFIGPNAVIIGGCRVGKNAIIGAGSVVTKDVPANSIVAGNPAKVISYQEND